MDKILVIKDKEVWGYKEKANEKEKSNYAILIRRTDDINFRNYPVAHFPVLVTGSICLYFNGTIESSRGKITRMYTGDPVPCYVSIGLDGKVMEFSKLDNVIKDDPQLLDDIKNLKKLRSADQLNEYINDRAKIILDYNKRHPSGNTEINILEKMLVF